MNVTQEHNNLSRDGLYVDAAFTPSAAALARGLLVNAVRPDAVRVAPPLLVTEGEIDAALDILGEVTAAVLADAPAPPED